MHSLLSKSPLLLLLICGFSLVVCQQNKDTTGTAPAESEARVGWTAGPTGRSTMILLWSCLSTIFASTWTVLHLNVPGQNEPGWKTAGRKVKWMAITVLFPEFIFSKAICELRQAVADLQYMHMAMKKNPLKWKDIMSNTSSSETHMTVSWEVDFNSRMRKLYRLLGLPALPPADEDEEKQDSIYSPVGNNDYRSSAGLSDIGTNTDGAPDTGGDGSGDYALSVSRSDDGSNDDYRSSTRLSDIGTNTDGAPDTGRDGSGDYDLSTSRSHNGSLSSNDTPAQEQSGGCTHADSQNLGQVGDRISKDTEHEADAMAAQQAGDASGSLSVGEQELQPPASAGAARSPPQRPPSRASGLHIYKLRPEKRYWTLSHSIYANMGGLVYRRIFNDLQSFPPLNSHTLAYNIDCCFPDAIRLKDLVLYEEDIKDKSKADWLLKTIAVLQIGWLILNACARAATGLPVTQLEVATGAFAVMAIATFVINWWKPKDVSRPTLISLVPGNFLRDIDYRCQSFARRILSPSKAADVPHSFDLKRISNDTIWMQGKPPLALVLIALSSVVFGGLHGLAWNSEFPSRVELVLWRTSVVTAAALPGVTLAITIFIEHLATNLPRNRFSAAVVKLLAHLDQVPPEYWAQFNEPPTCLSWPPESQFVFYKKLSQVPPDADLNWEEMPTPPDSLPPGARKTVQDNIFNFQETQNTMRSLAMDWVMNRSDYSTIVEAYEWFISLVTAGVIKDHELFDRQWRQYEGYLKSKTPGLKSELREFCVRDFVVSKIGDIQSLEQKRRDLENNFNMISRYVAVGSCIIYTIARIAILVLIFSSLRSVSDSVYKDVLWTRFLPNFS
ncbi:Major facilitator superfamily domain general substrate transporter protein [Rutstroemia sp. NJR-2017a BVV2]|nr:Major facilitator superfamily domain general substrate transporter protein [Rutstroemia sp. NJR-2017a BVV2]